MSSPQILTVPKEFFVEERNKFYDAWVEAFPREFFQNSVDAGAKTIRVRIDEAKGKGSFGRDPHRSSVTRFVFEDDGHGMSHQVLENVFFTLGASTKRDENSSVGGFGRARIMQAFSQDRYSIRTRDRYVEGDGPERINLTVAQAKETLFKWAEEQRERARALLEAGEDAKASALFASADLHEGDATYMEDAPLAGCRFEVDLDPNSGNYRNRPTVERMKEAILSYMSKSDVDADVFLNGERVNQPKRKMEKRKVLYATFPSDAVPEEILANKKVKVLDRADGMKDVPFATLYTVKPEEIRDGEKGRLNVRVRGASMFNAYSNSDDHAIVLEIMPSIAREVLTSNRDALRTAYRDSVDAFSKQLATDASKAFDVEEKSVVTLQGGLGGRTRRRKPVEVDMASGEALHERVPGEERSRVRDLERKTRETNSVRYPGYWSDFVKDGLAGVPAEDFLAFFAQVRKSGIQSTFLVDYADRTAIEVMASTLERHGDNAALEAASGVLLGHITANLKLKRAVAEANEAVKYADKMADLHHVTILKTDMVPQEEKFGKEEREERRKRLAQATRRYDPRNWDVGSGKGMAPRKLLAAWDVAVDHCVDALLDAFPHVEPFPYNTGWTFSHKKWDYSPITGKSQWSNTGAMFMRTSGDETRNFLLNPLDDDTFKARFNPRDAGDRARIMALAAHEVAHTIAETSHNEAFATAYTRIVERILNPQAQRTILKEMSDRIAAVDAVYGRGKTTVQPMDDAPGERPSLRLLGASRSHSLIRVAETGALHVEPLSALDSPNLDDPEIDYGMRM